VDFAGWVGVGLGGNCDYRCGILYAPMLGGGALVYAGLVRLTSPYSSELFVLGVGVGLPPWFCYVCVCVGLAHLVFYGRQNKCVKCRNG